MKIFGGVLVVLYIVAIMVVGCLVHFKNDEGVAVYGVMAVMAMFFYGLYLAVAAIVHAEYVALWLAVPMMLVPGITVILVAIGGTCATIAKGFFTVAGLPVCIGWLLSTC